MQRLVTVAVLFIVIVLILVSASVIFLLNMETTESVSQYTYSIVKTFPHDQNAFTEGLFYANGFLYESTGLTGASTLRRVDLTSGKVLQQVSLPKQYFGEGIALVNETIFQLTYKSNIGFIYDKNSFSLVGNFSYPTEGWGLTFDGKRLIMSDGSDSLYFLDPKTQQKIGQIQVHDGNASVFNLNELEYVNGDIYANIFEDAKIAIINPGTGQVISWIDLSGLQQVYGASGVLNGIAYNIDGNKLLVTGKNWSKLFEIELVPQNAP